MQKKPKKSKETRGRPPLPEGDVRDQRLVGVRFSRAEIEALRERAAEAGQTWTEWCRSRLGL